MNTKTEPATPSRLFLLRVRLRDLDAPHTVCRQRGWELCRDQPTFRWCGPPTADITLSPGLGRCAHALVIPGCRSEIGLQARGDHWQPLWDHGNDLETVLGAGCRLLWRAYALEVIDRAAREHGHALGLPLEIGDTRRVRVVAPRSSHHARICLGGKDEAVLRTFGLQAQTTFRYLANALGHSNDLLPLDGEVA